MSEVVKGKSEKTKKKKKKSNTGGKNHGTTTSTTSASNVEVDTINSTLKLPKTTNQKTYFNEVEVTMSVKKNPEADLPTLSKPEGNPKNMDKKKHLISPQIPPQVVYPNVTNKQVPVLNISDAGRIELTNHPEITVFRTRNNEGESSKPGASAVKDLAPTSKASEQVDSNTSTQKKKRKKNKNKAASSEPAVEPQNTSAANNSEPTYVKVPTTGDDCVLIVSHENFKSNNAQVAKTTTNDSIHSKINNLPESSAVTIKSLPESNSVAISSSENNTVTIKNLALSGSVPAQTKQEETVADPHVVPQTPALPVKTKAQRKAENKALVEVQLVTKMAKKLCEMSEKGSKKSCEMSEKGSMKSCEMSEKGSKKSCEMSEKGSKAVTSKTAQESEKKPSKVKYFLFSHLPQYKSLSSLSKHLELHSQIHPAVAAVGVQCAEGIISGSDARCVAILSALKEVINDYKTPLNKELSRDLESNIDACVKFISECRPLSVSMSNAVKYLKYQITSIPATDSDDAAKDFLGKQIEKFVLEEICLARAAISSSASEKIVDKDVILTYGYSSLIKDVLFEARRKNRKFKVIVVDSGPKMEGREMLRCLVKQNIQCSYILISGISYVMKQVTKIFIGAHSLQANGYVMSRVGSSQIALVASSYNVPFLVCCETYKFSERVHTDSFVYNELGNPDSFLNCSKNISSVKEDWQLYPQLQLLNPLYDITPPHLVSMVITEKGMLPCTSVPVVLRVRHAGSHE